MSLMDTDLDAIERDWPMTNRPEGEVITALVRELREARRRLAELGKCRAPGTCQCSDDEACRFVRERDEARRELDEAKRTVAAASRYMFGRDEAIARAERSEAELEQLRVVAAACVARESRQSPADDSLRAALAASEKRRAELAHEVEVSHSVVESKTKWGNALFLRAERAEAACAQMRAALELLYPIPEAAPLNALASDCGKGWVSPEQYAEVVRVRDAAMLDAFELREELAEVTAQRDAANARLERLSGQASRMEMLLLGVHRACVIGHHPTCEKRVNEACICGVDELRRAMQTPALNAHDAQRKGQ